MEMNRQTLGQRISLTLRAKQSLVFYAILLFAIDFWVPPVAALLHDHRALADLLSEAPPLFAGLFSAPGLSLAAIVLANLLLVSWLRCGYIRSIVGTLHLRPQDGFQFLSMLGLEVITEAVRWAGWLGYDTAGRSQSLTSVFYVVLLGVYFVLLYADYAIVISGVDPITAIHRSWTAATQNAFVSLVVLLGVTLVSYLMAALLDTSMGHGVSAVLAPTIIHVLAMGTVTFVADVSLIVTYIASVERGALPVGKG
jgi:hypothetical protein